MKKPQGLGRRRRGGHNPRTRARRVVVATRVFAPDAGAAAHRWTAWTRQLASRARSVTVLTTKPAHSGTMLLPRNVSVSRWPVLRDKDGSVRGYLPYLSFDIPLFFRLLSGRRPDVVLCEPPPTTGAVTRVACFFRRVPYIYCAVDLLGPAAAASGVNRAVVKIVSALERFALRGAAEVLAVSPAVAQEVERYTKRPPTIVPHSVEESEPKTQCAALPWPSTDGPVFLYSGTVTEWMGADIFLEAAPTVFERFPSALLVFMGQGTGWDALQDAVDRLNDPRVICSSDARIYEAAATVTLAALKPGPYDFAYTTKVLTSLSAGTPVVYAGVGPAAEDIRNASLGTVTSFDPEEVANAMIFVARNVLSGSPDFRSERLKEWVRNHRSADQVGEELWGVLEKAVAAHRRKRTRSSALRRS